MNTADITTGTVVDRYTVRKVLGEGGMAIVYQVEHNQLGSLHALKVLTLANKQVRERLLLEGRAQATLRHPNVVTVTDVVDLAGAPGLIMEFIEGPSLDDYLEHQPLSIDQVDSLARGILAGVAAAHDAGLVHRDLKPANIMLAIGSGGLIPKVTDFGLAKIVAAEGAMSKTRTGATMGTPHYMSPEQIDDSKNVGPATDIWALGAILYEMLTQERAFPGDNLLTIFSAVDKVAYVPIRERVPTIPDRMANAIEAALSRTPSDRPTTVQELFALWAGDTLSQTVNSMPMGPWDASALALARSTIPSNASPITDDSAAAAPTYAGSLTNSNSLITSRAAWIGLGGSLLGLGGVSLALVALIAVAGGAYLYSTLPAREVRVEVPVPVPGSPTPEAVAPPEDTTNASATLPNGSPPPAPSSNETVTAPTASPSTDEAVEDDPTEEPVEPIAEAPEPSAEPDDVPADDGSADADSPPQDLSLGLLASRDPEERISSVRRQLAQADEDTSRRFLAMLKSERDSSVRTVCLEAMIQLWDNKEGHWDTNRDGVVLAFGFGTKDASKAAAAYGRNGRDPMMLATALKHSNVEVRKAALDAMASVRIRATDGVDPRPLVEPLANDPDNGVAKKAQKLLSSM